MQYPITVQMWDSITVYYLPHRTTSMHNSIATTVRKLTAALPEHANGNMQHKNTSYNNNANNNNNGTYIFIDSKKVFDESEQVTSTSTNLLSRRSASNFHVANLDL